MASLNLDDAEYAAEPSAPSTASISGVRLKGIAIPAYGVPVFADT